MPETYIYSLSVLFVKRNTPLLLSRRDTEIYWALSGHKLQARVSIAVSLDLPGGRLKAARSIGLPLDEVGVGDRKSFNSQVVTESPRLCDLTARLRTMESI